MKPKLFIILNLFFTLSLFSFFGCTTVKKAYDGQKLTHDQIARISCDTRPIEIRTMVTPGPNELAKWRGWGVRPGYFESDWILEVLPGTYDIKFEVHDPPYVKRFWYKVKVKAGHTYRIDCNRHIKYGTCNSPENWQIIESKTTTNF
jgi:hypothetical protein